jgi:hypothetical protein
LVLDDEALGQPTHECLGELSALPEYNALATRAASAGAD